MIDCNKRRTQTELRQPVVINGEVVAFGFERVSVAVVSPESMAPQKVKTIGNEMRHRPLRRQTLSQLLGDCFSFLQLPTSTQCHYTALTSINSKTQLTQVHSSIL